MLRRFKERRAAKRVHKFVDNGVSPKYRVTKRREEKGLVAKLEDMEKEIEDAGRKGFFSKARVALRRGRVAKRRDFRVKVSGNRKWMLIGLAVVVVCITIIYLSVTYGSKLF